MYDNRILNVRYLWNLLSEPNKVIQTERRCRRLSKDRCSGQSVDNRTYLNVQRKVAVTLTDSDRDSGKSTGQPGGVRLTDEGTALIDQRDQIVSCGERLV